MWKSSGSKVLNFIEKVPKKAKKWVKTVKNGYLPTQIFHEPRGIEKICLDIRNDQLKLFRNSCHQIFRISIPYALKLSSKLGGITKNKIFGDFDLNIWKCTSIKWRPNCDRYHDILYINRREIYLERFLSMIEVNPTNRPDVIV